MSVEKFIPSAQTELPEHPKKMPLHDRLERKKTLSEKIDVLLRDRDTAFAKLLGIISPKKGEEYLNGTVKKLLDLSIAVPAVIVATPVITVLGIAKKVEDGGTAFFIQERYQTIPEDEGGEADTFKMWKIRSMYEGAEKNAGSIALRGTQEKHDPRATRLGKILRKFKLDELPQFYQVILGELSTIGVRPIPDEPLLRIKERHASGHVPHCIFDDWKKGYNKSKKGLTGLSQVRESGRRIDEEAFHYDTFYTKNASLGLDLYLIWATLGRILGTYPRRKSRVKDTEK